MSAGASRAWTLLGTLLLGGIGGAGLHAVFTNTPAASPEPARVALVTPSVAPSASASEAILSVEDLPADAPHPHAKPPPSSSHHGAEPVVKKAAVDDLGRERALLAIARTAVARGQGDAALTALDRHAQQYPNGQLSEERESLRIQALVAAGRKNEAERRATDFRGRYPESLQKKAIETSLGTP